ncbi:MAG: hypothetical protein ACRDN9_19750 [Streptosporangiaceae bacterium]
MLSRRPRRLLASIIGLAGSVLLVAPLAPAASADTAHARASVSLVTYHVWTSVPDFAHGTFEGSVPAVGFPQIGV